MAALQDHLVQEVILAVSGSPYRLTSFITIAAPRTSLTLRSEVAGRLVTIDGAEIDLAGSEYGEPHTCQFLPGVTDCDRGIITMLPSFQGAVRLVDLELTRACEARPDHLLACCAVRNHGSGARLLVTRCSFTDNEYHFGAAIRSEAGTLLQAFATNFTTNRVKEGALHLVGDALLEDCNFEDNIAISGEPVEGGALRIRSAGQVTSVTLRRCTVSGNSARQGGGAPLHTSSRTSGSALWTQRSLPHTAPRTRGCCLHPCAALPRRARRSVH